MPDTSPQSSRTIKRKAKKGILFFSAGQTISKVLTIVSFVIVANFLTPAEIGVASLAGAVIMLVRSVLVVGLPSALVQIPELTKEHTSSSFWFLLCWSFFLVAAVVLSAPVAELFFQMTDLSIYISGGSAQLVFFAMSVSPTQILIRNLDFGYVAAIETIGTFSSAVTKVALAILGTGPWALVMGPVANSVVKCALTFWIVRFLPAFRIEWSSLRPLLNFGFKQMFATFINRFYRDADYLIVGKFLGEEFLGIYRVGFELGVSPVLTIVKFFNKVIFSVFSRLQHSLEELRDYYLKMSRNLFIIVGPISVFLFSAADDIITMAFDPAYQPAVIVIEILCFMVLMRALTQISPRLLSAVGRPGLTLWNSVITMVLLTSAFLVAVLYWGKSLGMLPICLAWLLSYPILWTIVLAFIKSQIQLPIKTYFRNLAAPMAGIVIMGLMLEGIKLTGLTPLPSVNIVLLAASGLAFYLLFVTKVLKIDLKGIFPGKSKQA